MGRSGVFGSCRTTWTKCRTIWKLDMAFLLSCSKGISVDQKVLLQQLQSFSGTFSVEGFGLSFGYDGIE